MANQKVDLRMGDNDRLRFKNSCTIGNFSGGSSSSGTSGDIDFNIFFASPADFAELTEDWDIISQSCHENRTQAHKRGQWRNRFVDL